MVDFDPHVDKAKTILPFPHYANLLLRTYMYSKGLYHSIIKYNFIMFNFIITFINNRITSYSIIFNDTYFKNTSIDSNEKDYKIHMRKLCKKNANALKMSHKSYELTVKTIHLDATQNMTAANPFSDTIGGDLQKTFNMLSIYGW